MQGTSNFFSNIQACCVAKPKNTVWWNNLIIADLTSHFKFFDTFLVARDGSLVFLNNASKPQIFLILISNFIYQRCFPKVRSII